MAELIRAQASLNLVPNSEMSDSDKAKGPAASSR
jgi:hypothetical protein